MDQQFVVGGEARQIEVAAPVPWLRQFHNHRGTRDRVVRAIGPAERDDLLRHADQGRAGYRTVAKPTDDRVDQFNAALEGRYRIERTLGEGGMATVYLALDVRHERHVALKVLKPELSAVVGADRFLSEIQVTAKLQHPHILPLFDSGEADGLLYFVMPYVEGESLRARLDRERQLPIEDVLTITAQVASALDYAHRQGIVHRDIKPANILMEDGSPVVADFGIARALSAAGGEHLTETGISIGTPLYMSPEQAAGEGELDGRCDEYALACVVHEMLGGTPPFAAATAQAILTQKMSREPPSVRAVRSSVPEPMAAVLQTSLARLPADRFATVTEFAEALRDPSRPGPHTRRMRPRRAAPIGLSGPLPWVVAGLAVVGLAWSLIMRPDPDIPHMRVGIVLESPQGEPATGFDISRDGKVIAWVAGPQNRMYVRRIDERSVTALPGTEGSFDPSFSPDGQFIAFAGPAREQIRRVALAGGPPVDVTDQADYRRRKLDWGADGFIYFTHRDGSLARVAAEGGDVERLTELNAELESAHFGPASLPNGRGVLFSIRRWPDVRNEIAVLDLESREIHPLQSGVYAMYSESGHLIVVRSDGTLVATPFDADRLELTGASVAVGRTAGGELSSLALSSTGTLLYSSGLGERGLAVVDRRGKPRWLGSNTAHALHPTVSPDGRWIATDLAGPNSIGIWIYDLHNGTFSPLTFDHDDIYPAFSADGRSVLFARAPVGNPGGAWVFHSVAVDGSGDPQPYLGLGVSQVEILQSRDRRWLIYRQGDLARAAGADIYYIDTAGDGTPKAFAATRFEETGPALSPDGRWLAYVSDESGSWEVYVQSFPGGGAHHRISTDGGSEPVWATDGRTLYYRSSDYLVAAGVAATQAFRITRRDTLFSVSSFEAQSAHHAYAVLPGDSGFVFTALSERAQLVMVLDWFEELRDGSDRTNSR